MRGGAGGRAGTGAQSGCSARLGSGLALDTLCLLAELLRRTWRSRAVNRRGRDWGRLQSPPNPASTSPGIDWERAMSSEASESRLACRMFSEDKPPMSVRVF